MIGSWVTPPTTGTIEIKHGDDENTTINHGCRKGTQGDRQHDDGVRWHNDSKGWHGDGKRQQGDRR